MRPLNFGTDEERLRRESDSNGTPERRNPRAREREIHSPVLRDLGRRFAAIEGSPVFAGAPDHILYQLARNLHHIQPTDGSMVVTQGEPGSSMFLITQGICEVCVTSADGGLLTVSMLGPGDCFSEQALISDDPNLVSVRATKDAHLLALNRDSSEDSAAPRTTFHKRMAGVIEQRRLALQRLAVRAASVGHRQGGLALAIYSPRGGSGKTTVAINLAATLGAKYPDEVLLIDLALPYSHAALYANLAPTASLAAMIETPEASFDKIFMGAILHHRKGLAVLPSVIHPHDADLITPALVAKAMTAAQRHFRFVIVDLGVALSDVTLTVFDHSHRLALITPPEAAALRDTGELLSLLPSALNVPESQTTVILNHVSKYSQLNQKDVELIIDRKIDIEIAHDGPKPEKALLVGQLLAVTDPTSTITKGAAALAAILEGDRNRVGDHGGHAERDPEKAPAEDRSATPAQSQVQLSASSALLGTTA